MALTNLAVFGGAFFTPILVGRITHSELGWPWTFYFVAIFVGVCLPLVFFFVPETAFRRSADLSIDLASSDDVRLVVKSAGQGHSSPSAPTTATTSEIAEKQSAELETQQMAINNTIANNRLIPVKKSYRESLWLFSGRKSDESFFKLLLRPFPLLFHPGIMWAMFIQGTLIGWTVFIGIILAAIFLGPPLFWDEVKTGYAYTGAFIGAVLGFVVAGGLADWSAKYLTRKNNGIYEPEFRIWLVVPQFVFGCAGLYGFGVTASRIIDYNWFWPIFFFALEVMGMVIGAVGR